MKIEDESKGIKFEIKTSLSKTRYEVTDFEMAAIVGSYMGQNDLTTEQFVNRFLSEVTE